MLITKKSTLTGATHTVEIPVTKDQIELWQRGTAIQHAMPSLSCNHREFLISGVTPEEWDEHFKDIEDE